MIINNRGLAALSPHGLTLTPHFDCSDQTRQEQDNYGRWLLVISRTALFTPANRSLELTYR